MSGSLTLALRTAQSGLLGNQSALNSVSQNVANVNTPNYSRKIVNMEQRVVAGVGAGVQLSEVSRAVDEGLLKSLRLELSSLKQYSTQTSSYERLQDLFGAPGDNTSISHVMTEFGIAMESLTLAPDQSLEQSEFVRQAQEVADKFQSMSTTVQELRLQADSDIATVTSSINTLSSELVSLNNKIIQNSTISADVTDLKDQRDAKLDELAGLIDISYFYRGDGDVVVFTTAGRTLVDNSSVTTSHLPATAVSPTTTHAEGDFSAIYVGTQIAANDITNEVRDGQLKGLIDLRDGTLADLQSQLDELAAEFHDAINLIHNQGSPHPGSSTMNGTRAFLNADVQTITMGNNSDSRLTLFDSTGNQHETTTIQAIMASASFGTGAQAANGPWNITEVAATMEDWLQANGAPSATVAINATTKKLDIAMNSSTYSLGMRDEVNTAGTVPAPVGSTAANATIQFDANGDANTDQTVSGFSNFFGLNDLFLDERSDNIHETEVMASTFSASAATLTVYNGTTTVFNSITSATFGGGPAGAGDTIQVTLDTNTMTGGAASSVVTYTAAGGETAEQMIDGLINNINLSGHNGAVTATKQGTDQIVITADNAGESITTATFAETSSLTHTAANTVVAAVTGSTNIAITAGESLTTIAANINATTAAGVTASVVPDGAGFRLRIASNSGGNISVTQASGNTFLTTTGMHVADVRVASQLRVREDVVSSPSKVTRGAVQWDATKGAAGEYFQSKGDNTLIKSMSQMYASVNTFDSAGALGTTSMTFTSRATSILSYNATKADLNESQRSYQESLSTSLQTKSDTFRGVNLDEEMANLILYEQGYSASARIISVIQDMFDALESIIT